MHGHAPPACHIADNGIARNRIAAFGAIDHEIVMAQHEDRGIPDPEHSFDRRHEFLGLLTLALRFFLDRLPGEFRQNLPSRILSISQIGV